MELSIIVPVYNTSQDKLKRCFESIDMLRKDRLENEIECIIVDDGSDESTQKFCSGFADAHVNFIYCRKKNGGVSSARNLGLDKARGNFICFVDSDDVVESNGFTETYFIRDCDLLFTDLEIYNVSHKEVWRAFDKAEGTIVLLDVLQKISGDGKLNGPVCKKIKKSFLVENDIRFRENIISGEDAIFLMEMLGKCPSMYYIPEIGYRYYLEADTSKNRLLKNTRLVIDNNCVLYKMLINLIHLCLDDEYITSSDSDSLIGKSTERYIKQIFNIASSLSVEKCLDEQKKRLVLKALQPVRERVYLIQSRQSKFQYRTLTKRNWKLVRAYGSARTVYLAIKRAI